MSMSMSASTLADKKNSLTRRLFHGRTVRFPMFLLILMLLILPGSVQPTSVNGRADGGELVGTWVNTVKIVTCPPAPEAVILTFQTMTTYMRGGILIEGGGPTNPPAVSRSAGHGIWERTSRHSFNVFNRFHAFDNLGRLVRINEVKTHPSLIKGDNPETPDVIEPYYLSQEGGTSKVTNINPVDGSVINVTAGCNKSTSRPVLFED